MYKTENELREVISLSKPKEVVDIFLESYLQGVEYSKWSVDKDLEATEDVVVCQDEDGNDILETRLINVYESVDVSEQMKQWKLNNYQLLRQPLYPNMEEYIDAVVKGDIEAQDRYIAKCLDVKALYPKEFV